MLQRTDVAPRACVRYPIKEMAQAAGLIHCGRGRITVVDRPPLEQRICERYGVLKKEMDRLL